MKKTIETINHQLIENLITGTNSLPSPLNESTMTYNYNKLMNILQKQEVEKLVSDKDLRDLGISLAVKYQEITKAIISKGPIPEVLESYNRLEEQVENSLSGIMTIFTKQWGLSVKALYYYKKGDYGRAFDLSLECVILNDYLVQEGVYSLIFRIGEQNKNISRVFFKEGNFIKGAQIAGSLLKYLFNGDSGNLYSQSFKDSRFWKEMPYVREGYGYECFLAFVSLFMHIESSHGDMHEVYVVLFGDLQFDINTPDRLIIANWLSIKKQLYTDGTEKFINECMEFLNEPLSKFYNLLKISLIMDLKRILRVESDRQVDEIIVRLDSYLQLELNASELLKRDLSAKNLVSIEK